MLVIFFQGILKAWNKIFKGCIFELVLLKILLNALLHDISSKEIVNLLKEAGARPVANLVKDINGIICMIHSHRYGMGSFSSIISQSLSKIMLNCKSWIFHIVQGFAFLKTYTGAVVSKALFKPKIIPPFHGN